MPVALFGEGAVAAVGVGLPEQADVEPFATLLADALEPLDVPLAGAVEKVVVADMPGIRYLHMASLS